MLIHHAEFNDLKSELMHIYKLKTTLHFHIAILKTRLYEQKGLAFFKSSVYHSGILSISNFKCMEHCFITIQNK